MSSDSDGYRPVARKYADVKKLLCRASDLCNPHKERPRARREV